MQHIFFYARNFNVIEDIIVFNQNLNILMGFSFTLNTALNQLDKAFIFSATVYNIYLISLTIS